MADLTVNDYIYVKLNDLTEWLQRYDFPSIIDDMYSFFPSDFAWEYNQALGFSSSDTLKDNLDVLNNNSVKIESDLTDITDKLALYFEPTSSEDKLLEDYQPNVYDLLYNQSVSTGTQDLIDKLDEFNNHFDKLENLSMCILFVVTISFGFRCLKSVVTQLLRM